MTDDEFRKHLEDAKAIVKTWPIWKQNLLEDSGKPTIKTPREPVDNSKATEGIEDDGY